MAKAMIRSVRRQSYTPSADVQDDVLDGRFVMDTVLSVWLAGRANALQDSWQPSMLNLVQARSPCPHSTPPLLPPNMLSPPGYMPPARPKAIRTLKASEFADTPCNHPGCKVRGCNGNYLFQIDDEEGQIRMGVQ